MISQTVPALLVDNYRIIEIFILGIQRGICNKKNHKANILCFCGESGKIFVGFLIELNLSSERIKNCNIIQNVIIVEKTHTL